MREPGLFPDGFAPFADAMAGERAPAPGAGEIDAAGQVLELLGASALDVDDLVRQAALLARVVKAALLELEMEGRARRTASGGYVLAEPRGVRP